MYIFIRSALMLPLHFLGMGLLLVVLTTAFSTRPISTWHTHFVLRANLADQHAESSPSVGYHISDIDQNKGAHAFTVSSTRRCLFSALALIPIFSGQPFHTVHAAPTSSNLSPDQAFDNLVQGREELINAAREFLPGRQLSAMREYLDNDDREINNYESNAQVLLSSKRLDVESKKAIGTIRRYGVGADVMIMYGGLRAELDQDNPNFAEVSNYLVKTLDSLEEVIVICRSNGFGKTKKSV